MKRERRSPIFGALAVVIWPAFWLVLAGVTASAQAQGLEGPSKPTAPAPAPATAAPAPAPAVSGQRPSAPLDAAPRPAAEVRVQNRFARNAHATQVFVGVDYLERRDFYISPGVRVGGTYFLGEAWGLEVQASHFFSSLNQAGEQVQRMYGVLPDSRAPGWLLVGGARYAMGYGKMMIGGIARAIHFQPQATLQLGAHLNEGSFGPSGLLGLGLLVHLTPRWFVRLDGAMTMELESRSEGVTTVLGFLPSLVAGGAL